MCGQHVRPAAARDPVRVRVGSLISQIARPRTQLHTGASPSAPLPSRTGVQACLLTNALDQGATEALHSNSKQNRSLLSHMRQRMWRCGGAYILLQPQRWRTFAFTGCAWRSCDMASCCAAASPLPSSDAPYDSAGAASWRPLLSSGAACTAGAGASLAAATTPGCGGDATGAAPHLHPLCLRRSLD